MMEGLEVGETLSAEELSPCQICGRSFFPEVLRKHTPICQKAAAKRRKVFDSSRQRAEGTDIPTIKPIKPKLQSSTNTVKAEPPKKPSNWRRKHEDFIATIRAAKGLNQVIKDGGPLPPPPPPSYDPDYIQCPYCQRRFAEVAAERHIKFCREQAARMPKGKTGEVKKPPPRSQFKAPTVVKKTNSPAPTANTSASSRLPLRPNPGPTAGISSSKVPSSGIVKSLPSGLNSPLSGVAGKTRVAGSGYGYPKTTQFGLNMRKVPNTASCNNDCNRIEDGNGSARGKLCHACGTRYPVESAKFCCECGLRRMYM